MSYTALWGCWCGIIVLNLHALIEDNDVTKASFYEELEQPSCPVTNFVVSIGFLFYPK